MKKTVTFEVFERGYEKGLKGRVESFDIWLKSFRIDPSKFDFDAISKFLTENLGASVDLEKEVETLGQFLGFYSKEQEGLYHIPIVGVLGSGKTHLLHLIQILLQKTKTPLTYLFIDASSFAEVKDEEEEQQVFYQILDEIKAERFDVLLIDSCERDKDIANSLKRITNILKKGLLITSWTPEHWNYSRDDIEDFLSVSKEIYLNPIDKEATSQLISIILQYVSNGKFRLSKEVVERIHTFCGGLSGTIIRLLIKTLNETFLSHKKNVDEKSVEAAAKTLGLENISDRINKLTEHQIVILKHILLEHDKRGIRPSTLVEILEKDKATISYHLNILNRNRIVKQEKIGRSSFYYVSKEIKPFVQSRISLEGDYLA